MVWSLLLSLIVFNLSKKGALVFCLRESLSSPSVPVRSLLALFGVSDSMDSIKWGLSMVEMYF